MSDAIKEYLEVTKYYLEDYEMGYIVKSGQGHIMARFIQEVDAENYIKYANKMLAKYLTTDTREWNF